MKQIKTALFVDFDNIFHSLCRAQSLNMAIAMGNYPGQWLERLKKHTHPEGGERDFLVRRVYLNPNGKYKDEIMGNERGWSYLDKFRPRLIEAGFEVVDCPSLTQGLKNAADIRIVIDVLECLDETNIYDEFVIASGDSDFTPLCQKLRAKDHRVTILSCGNAVAAYHNIANFHLDMADLINHEQAKKCWSVAKDYIDNSDEPVLYANLVAILQPKFGETIDKSNWFGKGSFSGLVHLMGAESSIRVKGPYIWNVDKHDAPGKAVIDEEAKKSEDVVKDNIDNSNLMNGQSVWNADKHDAPEKDAPEKDTPEKDTPEKDTPEKDTPEKDTPEKDTPEKDTPEKMLIDEEQAKKCWDVAKAYIDNSNDPVLLADLSHKLHSEFGETIGKSEWFGMASLRRFVHSRGDEVGILMYDQYVWNCGFNPEVQQGDLYRIVPDWAFSCQGIYAAGY